MDWQKDANNLGSFKVDSFFAELVHLFSISKTGSRKPFCAFDRVYLDSIVYAYLLLWIVYECLLPPSYLPLVLSFFAFTFFSMELLFCEHTGRSSPVRRNQLSLSCDVKSAKSNLPSKTSIVLSCFFSIYFPCYQISKWIQKLYLPISWKVFVCFFSICHCALSYD